MPPRRDALTLYWQAIVARTHVRYGHPSTRDGMLHFCDNAAKPPVLLTPERVTEEPNRNRTLELSELSARNEPPESVSKPELKMYLSLLYLYKRTGPLCHRGIFRTGNRNRLDRSTAKPKLKLTELGPPSRVWKTRPNKKEQISTTTL